MFRNGLATELRRKQEGRQLGSSPKLTSCSKTTITLSSFVQALKVLFRLSVKWREGALR